jgi:transcriptional regulator with XRE-family HTH domain
LSRAIIDKQSCFCYSSNMGKLGTTIRQRRKDLHIKVKDLAQKTGVHPTYITYIEKHDRLPSLEIIANLEKHLNIELKQAYLEAKHPSLSNNQRADIVINLNSGQSLIVECKDPTRTFESELSHFLSAPTHQQDARASAISCLTRIDPELKNNKALVKTFTQRITALKKAYHQFQTIKTATVKELTQSLPPIAVK